MAILTTNYQMLGQAYLGTSGGNLYVRVYAKYSEQDIVNNRTKVQYEARTYYENSTYIYDAQGNGGVYGTSSANVSGSCTRPTTGETVIATTEAWVQHNDNGSQAISASAYLNFPNWNWSATATGTADLPTIPRASSIAVSNYNLGQNIGIIIGKKVNSFTSTLTYKIGSRTGTIISKTSSPNYTWEMSSELIEQIKNDNPSTKNVSAIIYCDTYNGDTKIGNTQSTNFTLVITDKPTITNVTIEETIELIKHYTTKIVKYLSIPKFNIVTTASIGTNIKTYQVRCGEIEKSSSNNDVMINNIQYSYLVENNRKTKFIVNVIDQRGNISDDYEIECEFIEYVNLAFNNTDIKLTRLNNVSNIMKLHMTGYVYNGLIGETQNSLTLKYRFKEKNNNSVTWSELKNIEATLNEDNTFMINDLQLESEFDYRINYDIEFYANDLFQQILHSDIIKTSEDIVKVHKNGMYIKNIDTKKLLINGEEVFDLDKVYPIGSLYLTTNETNPSDLFGGTWNKLEDETFLMSASAKYPAKSKGGENQHTLSINEMPYHEHAQFVTAIAGSGGTGVRRDYSADETGLSSYPQGINTGGNGNGQPHNNMPKFYAVYIWTRVS